MTGGFVAPERPDRDESELTEGPAPDAIEPITAFRAWVSLAPGTLLRSLDCETKWIPGEWMTARCSIRKNHDAPKEGCRCGFYATKELDEVLTIAGSMQACVTAIAEADGSRAGVSAPPAPEYAPPTTVVGRVHLAGKVIEHAHGYRAERARVAEILPVSGWSQSAALMAETYGVPLGEEIPAPTLPAFDSLPSVVISCPSPTTEPEEPTVIGRLFILAISLFCVINGMRGILWETHRLEWSDWWLCLIVISGTIGIWRAIRTFPQAARELSARRRARTTTGAATDHTPALSTTASAPDQRWLWLTPFVMVVPWVYMGTVAAEGLSVWWFGVIAPVAALSITGCILLLCRRFRPSDGMPGDSHPPPTTPSTGRSAGSSHPGPNSRM